ncbi:MAG TPA: LptF/LptG family permease [Chthonomonadaceae bacterium]|nr:LptF/LptG family permease [Chthonomonadaceae bacterium]
MKLLDRSLLREMVVPFLIGQAAIVLMLIGSVLYNNATVLLMNQVPLADVAKLILYFLPFLVHMTMPVAMAVGASMAVSRLGRDSEITVMRASGASLVRIFMPFLVVGLVASVTDFFFGELIVPLAVQRLEATLAEIPNHLPKLQPLAGDWIVSNDRSYVIYVKTMIPRRGYIELHGVMIVSGPKAIFSGESEPLHLYAENGRYRDGNWTLDHPISFTYTTDGKKVELTRPNSFNLFITVDPASFQSGFLLQLPMWTMARSSNRTFWQLGDDIRRNDKQHTNDVLTVLDYHFKLSIPFSCLVMALCCPPLSLRFAKGGGFMGVLLSICLVFVYWNTMLLARIVGTPGPESGIPLVPPVVAAWSQNVLFILIGLYVLRKSE